MTQTTIKATADPSLSDAGRSGKPLDAHETLTSFRRQWLGCLKARADSLFELTDALLCATGVRSIAHLSLEPVFRRGHGSAYDALASGVIDERAVRRLLADHRPSDWPPVFAIDDSVIARKYSQCSAEREWHHSSSQHTGGRPVVAGWSYQWVSQINPYTADSWTAPAHVRRVCPGESPNDVAIAQIVEIASRRDLADLVPLFVLDAGYNPARIAAGCAGKPAQILVRARDDRVLYRDPPPRPPGQRGRPRKHGPRFSCRDERTWGAPEDLLVIDDDPVHGRVEVRAWAGLHPQGEQEAVRATLIRVQVERLSRRRKGPKPLWLWWSGAGQPDLDLVWRAYLHRFDIEHTFRLYKGGLGWDTPAVMTPQQADRWAALIAVAHTQLRLARGLATDLRLPWERPCVPEGLSPRRVQRDFPRLPHRTGTPASPPKSSKAGPGRPKGSQSTPATRHPVIKKPPPIDADAA